MSNNPDLSAEEKPAAAEISEEGNITGIHPPYEIFYIESLLTITTSALDSVDRINAAVQNIQPAKHREIIDNAQNIINQAAALSRYFWATSKYKLHKSRSRFLREKLGIKESSLLKNRDVRNFIEHFDEKLDVFCNAPLAGTFFPMYVGEEIDSSTYFFFRAYFTDKAVFKILGMTYALEQIAAEILAIHTRLWAIKDNDGRFI